MGLTVGHSNLRNIKIKPWKQVEIEIQYTNTCGIQQKQLQKGSSRQGNKCLHEKTRKVLKNQPNFTAQGTSKRTKPKVIEERK